MADAVAPAESAPHPSPASLPSPASRPSARTGRMPGPARRRQLLDAALPVFAEKGFSLASMDEVAERAGVSKPVLYQHFGSKRALFLELLDDVGGQLMSRLAAATSTARGPREEVEAGFLGYFRFVAEQRAAFELLFRSGPRRDPVFQAAVARVEGAVANAIGRRISVDLDEGHRETLAYGLVGLAEGVSRRWVADGGVTIDTAGRLARQAAELAWTGLRGVQSDRKGEGDRAGSGAEPG